MPCTSSTMYAWNMEARSRFEVTPPTPTHTCAGICHPVPLLEGAAGMNSLICALVHRTNECVEIEMKSCHQRVTPCRTADPNQPYGRIRIIHVVKQGEMRAGLGALLG